MFNGRTHKTKKKGIYDAGLNGRKSVSMQIAQDYDKLSKYDANPKKAAKKAEKELYKKKKAMYKHNKKFRENKKHKVKTTKGKPGGAS